MPSPLEMMIDAAMVCLCKTKGRVCGCASGAWCGVCHKCAEHCDGTTSCDDWWLALDAELRAEAK
jgi:hypothetical protein